MNCPSRTEEFLDAGYNQNPPHLPSDLTTTADLNGIVNTRALRRASAEISFERSPEERQPPEKSLLRPESRLEPSDEKPIEDRRIIRKGFGEADAIRPIASDSVTEPSRTGNPAGAKSSVWARLASERRKFADLLRNRDNSALRVQTSRPPIDGPTASINTSGAPSEKSFTRKARHVIIKYGKFVGPGFMVSVAYIDPGNYSTDVAAGASYRFKLLFVVLMSNMFAVFLQSLCTKLGTVTGLNLAENCRAHCPKWLNISLYLLAEVAIIATDIAEVIGTAIALNLLCPKIPLVAGCALSILDVFLILVFYRPNASMKGLQAFEMFVGLLVIGVVVSFCLELSLIKSISAGEVFRGYLPSGALIQSEGLYQACGILGATVMPHSLYLGSGIVQPRLAAFDMKNGFYTPSPAYTSTRTSLTVSRDEDNDSSVEKAPYKPSIEAINFCLKYSIVELAISLFTFALFVNSAILIVSGASLSDQPDASHADIFSIHSLLSSSLSPAAGVIFALALLLSGISAGVVCTIAGQMVSEGALNWSIPAWARRLVTRSISITPSIIIAGAVGRNGLTAALNGTQVVLSVALPFVSAPLIWFTCRRKYMTVRRSSPLPPIREVSAPRPSPHDRNESDAFPHGSARTDAGELPLQRTSSSEPRPSGPDAPRRGGSEALEAGAGAHDGEILRDMRNHWLTTVCAVFIWMVIVAMNVANLALLNKD